LEVKTCPDVPAEVLVITPEESEYKTPLVVKVVSNI